MIFALGVFVFSFLHVYLLASGPGFHFDEAWAAQHSLKIAFESGFWPMRAMTVQTSSWSHYLTALFFKIFSPSVYVYRLSYVFSNIVALLLFSAALKNLGQTKAARFLPWVAALFPALLLNHRFAIEITSFHSLCLALIFYSLSILNNKDSKGAWLGIFVGSYLGFTSHVFFLAPLAALLLWISFSHKEILEKKQSKIFLSLLLLSFLPFVFSISQEIVWKWKGRALLLLMLLLLGWVLLFNAKLPRFFSKLKALFFLLSIPFAFNFLLFSEGHWIVLHHMGKITFPLVVGLQLVLTLFLFFVFQKKYFSKEDSLIKDLSFFLVLNLACSGFIMITQAPRYYEISFWILAMLLSLVVSRLWEVKKIYRSLFFAWLFVGFSQIAVNYFFPAYHVEGERKDFSFGVLRESSYDFVPKSRVAEFLSLNHCWQSLKIEDARLKSVFEVLYLLSQEKNAESCAWSKLCLQRDSSSGVDYAKILYQDQNFTLFPCR